MKKKFYSEHVNGTCSFIYSILAGADGLTIGDWIDAKKLIRPYRRCTLHDLISNAVDWYDAELFYDWPDLQLDGHRSVVRAAGLAFPTGPEQRLLRGEYTSEDKTRLYEVIHAATEKIVIPSVFHTLFVDRNFIVALQIQLREFLQNHASDTLSSDLDGRGRINRVHIPSWLKKALFFRDRGECQLCGEDISGIKSPFDQIHIDHVVPLADFGNNDPTNFQLVCSVCNLGKGVSTKYERSRFMPYWQESP